MTATTGKKRLIQARIAPVTRGQRIVSSMFNDKKQAIDEIAQHIVPTQKRQGKTEPDTGIREIWTKYEADTATLTVAVYSDDELTEQIGTMEVEYETSTTMLKPDGNMVTLEWGEL